MFTQIIKSIGASLLICGLGGVSFLYANSTPLSITFEAKIATQQLGNLNGHFDMTITLVGESFENGRLKTERPWSYFFKDSQQVEFINGVCSVLLGLDVAFPLAPEYFELQNPRFEIEINGLTAEFPLPSTPYSIQAQIAEEVARVDASTIKGEFVTTINISADLSVANGLLFVDSKSRRIGVGTKAPKYTLDIEGAVNAEGFKINGTDIESKLSWKKDPKLGHLYYKEGSVGIGTESPKYSLDVVGTVNANAFYRRNQKLEDWLKRELAWKDAGKDNIYFNDGTSLGNVGVGTSVNILERLTVAGAIKLDSSIQTVPVPGTIEFKDDDFWGYTKAGKFSLIGVRPDFNVVDGQIALWNGGSRLSSRPNFVFKNDKLGVGESFPTAKLDVRSNDVSEPLFHVKTASGTTAMIIDKDGHIGVGTDAPHASFAINGIIDAVDFYKDGVPLSTLGSEGSFWGVTDRDDLFFDKGYVGIGTHTPVNLLEISSPTGNVALTFDIAGEDLYSMGVDGLDSKSFVISEGGDLTKPIFVFNQSKIGVGTNTPKANLHVSGNTGLLVTGIFGDDVILPQSGTGTRLMYIPSKAAFRAGHVLGDRWDNKYIGNYSIAMGYNPKASGEGSVALGGYQSIATGKNSVAIGGYENEAAGENSFAVGHRAKALHKGSFVWGDYVPTANVFESVAANQFLIRANGGVGIGTNQTSDSVLTVKRDLAGAHLVVLGSTDKPDEVVVVDSKGGVGIGTADPGLAKLAVMGGNVGIGTTNPKASLTVESDISEGFMVHISAPFGGNVSTGSVVVITATGNVGIGLEDPQAKLHINGAIKANQFLAVDPDDPSQVIVLQPNSGSPWSKPTPENRYSTYRSQGFVGIGTPSPNALLELSNRGDNRVTPSITFDIDGRDHYTMGVVTSNTNSKDVFFVIQNSGTLNRVVSPLLLFEDKVGIGLNLEKPQAFLHVSGNTVISGNMAIGTTNVSSGFDVLVDGAVEVTTLNISGIDFSPVPSPWQSNGTDIFYTSGNVGIGASNPSEALDVAGTASFNRLVLSDQFVMNGDLKSKSLEFVDVSDNTTTGVLFVDNGQLTYRYPTVGGNDKVLSSPIQKKTQQGSGPLSYWVDNSTLGVVPIFWNNDTQTLVVTTNFLVKGYREDLVGFSVSSNVSLGSKKAIDITGVVSHKGNISAFSNYVGQDIHLRIDKDWGNESLPIVVKGMDITLSQDSGKFLNRAKAVGLSVDVSGVEVDTTVGGSKYAAIFKGGNVGIGVDSPTTALEVDGIVSANFFNLTGGLEVPQLTINKNKEGVFIDRLDNGKVVFGIGTDVPSTELEVVGVASINSLVVAKGLKSTTMNVGNNSFVVDKNGFIGIGTDQPNGQIELRKEIDSTLSADFISEKIGVEINAAKAPGFSFELQNNITGVDIGFSSASPANTLGKGYTATGISVNMTALKVAKESKVVGLDIDVSGDSLATRYAAIFEGGYVGIGTKTPLADLHVSGDIRAKHLFLEGNLQSDRATFNTLIVNKTASINAITVNTLAVTDLTTEKLTIATMLSAPEARVTTVNADSVSVNILLKANSLIVSRGVTANAGVFLTSVGIGRKASGSGLYVSGNVEADNFTITDTLDITSATLNVNNGTLFVGKDGKVGIGTTSPESKLSVVYETPASFDVANSDSWNAIQVQANSLGSNTAAGLLLMPDSTISTSSIGSGFVALKTASGIGSSDLLLITDPKKGNPTERMRITSEGFVGIGTSFPSAGLHVNGTAYFSDDVTFNGTLKVNTIRADEVLSLIADDKILINGVVSANNNVFINKSAFIKQLTPSEIPSALVGHGQLYVANDSKDLIYMYPSGSTRNISKAFTGAPGRVPFIDKNGNINDTALLEWNPDTTTFKVGTSNQLSKFFIDTSIDDSVSVPTVSAQDIQVAIGNRSGLGSGATITGLNVDLFSLNKSDIENFGRLANGETAIGLSVDVSNVVADYEISGTAFKGEKYAAQFLGGFVGIGTTTPAAALHIDSSNDVAFRVDSKDLDYALVVSENGYVGLGIVAPDSRLTIAGLSGSPTAGLLEVVSNNRTLFIVRNDGHVGVGTSNPTVEFEVSGDIKATNGEFTYVKTASMNIGSSALVVQDGKVGIGTANPDGQISFYKLLDTNAGDTTLTGQKMELVVDGVPSDIDGGSFLLNKSITGLSVDISSKASNKLAAGNTATGLTVDLTGIELANTAKAIGLDVDVTGVGGTRYSAIFNGGNVGIGTSTPLVALDVSGDIRAKSLELSEYLIADTVTVNRLYVSGDVTFNGSVSVNALYAKFVSANNITLEGTLQVSTGSFVVVTANKMAAVGSLAIGKDAADTSLVLDVNGSANFVDNLTIKGDLSVDSVSDSTAITFASNNGAGDINAATDLTVTKILTAGWGLRFKAGGSADVVNNNATPQLFSDINGDLVYHKPSGNDYNLTKIFGGVPGSIPYYDASGGIASDARLYWNNNGQFQVGTKNALTALVVNSTLKTSSAGVFSAQIISMNVQDRSGANFSGESKFYGINIDFNSTNPTDPYGFGRLAQGETAVGVYVDVSGLAAKSSTGEWVGAQTGVEGYKYAAQFLGGSVGIATDTPQATLHIGNVNASGSPLRIDYVGGTHALVVSKNGNVGINTNNPDAKLTIKQSDLMGGALHVKDKLNASVLYVSDKVGIGHSAPSSQLHVKSATASPLSIESSSGTKAIYVNPEGKLGLGGVSNPVSDVHIGGDFSIESGFDANALVVKNGKVGIGTQDPKFPLSVNGLISASTGDFIPAGFSVTDRGFLSVAGIKNFAYFGLLPKTPNSTEYNTVLRWSGGSDDKFLIQKGMASPITIMSMDLDGTNPRVGIGTATPTSSLTIQGGFRVDTVGGASKAFYVDKSGGQVGVNIDAVESGIKFQVKGAVMAKKITITDGTVAVSTVNVSGALKVDQTIKDTSTGPDYKATEISVRLDSDVNRDIYGMKVHLKSNPNLELESERPYTLWNAAAYGVYVDVSSLEVRDPTVGLGYDVNNHKKGNKYAAAFMGGPVGIGIDRPIYPLHVQGAFRSAIAKFGTSASELLIRDYDEGVIGLNVINVHGKDPGADGIEDETLVLTPGKVGIGTTAPDKELTVNGDVRIGLVTKADYNNIGEGNKLYFSGGPRLTGGISGDNGDELSIGRYNSDLNKSQLRVNFSTIAASPAVPDGNDKFIWGFTDNTATFKPVLVVQNDGKVGITQGDTSFTPSAMFHIAGTGSGGGPSFDKKNHVAIIENSSEKFPNILALVHAGNSTGSVPDDVNFVTFFNGTTELGAIEGNNGNGVRYMTKGGDYAEYLEKLDVKEAIEAGDIVGVIDGKISKSTQGAQQLLVRSTAAAVAGNWPGADKTGYELVAFFGQVKVKVKGIVSKGDYILPSGNGDGIGIAVSAPYLKDTQRHLIIGRAWSASVDESIKKIQVAVGFNFSMPSYSEDLKVVQNLESEVKELMAKNTALITQLEGTLDSQDNEIKMLMDELKKLKNAK